MMNYYSDFKTYLFPMQFNVTKCFTRSHVFFWYQSQRKSSQSICQRCGSGWQANPDDFLCTYLSSVQCFGHDLRYCLYATLIFIIEIIIPKIWRVKKPKLMKTSRTRAKKVIGICLSIKYTSLTNLCFFPHTQSFPNENIPLLARLYMREKTASMPPINI